MRAIVAASVAATAIVLAGLAHADGSASLNAAVEQLYNKYQARCTPLTPPHFQGIQITGDGHGRVIDTNPSLGGPFEYMKLPNGAPGVPGAQYLRADANDGSGIYYVAFNFC